MLTIAHRKGTSPLGFQRATIQYLVLGGIHCSTRMACVSDNSLVRLEDETSSMGIFSLATQNTIISSGLLVVSNYWSS